ncbi:DUF4214 domain-containing protein [Massilia endophytica]|nr:DUF4214 domain-containing protein [Massilia endophytica]
MAGRPFDYSVRVNGGHVQVSQLAPSTGNTDSLHNVEILAFTEAGTDTADAIGRLYEALLDRDANAAEVAFWQELQEQGASLQSLALRIAFSQEAGVSTDAGFVTALYERVLDRVPGEGELQAWLARMEQGMDRGAVALGFVNSAEKLGMTYDVDIGSSDVGVLVRLYHSAFGRAPDEAGINTWLVHLEKGMSIGDVADAFAAAMIPDRLPVVIDNEGFIQQVYTNALHRNPTGEESAFMLKLMENPVFDRGQVLLTVSESFEAVQLVGVIDSDIVIV